MGRSAILLAAAGSALVACGSTAQPEVQSAAPLTAQSVSARQTGNAPAQVVTPTISYQLDDSGSLVIHLTVRSQAPGAETVTVRASLFDAGGALIGDATGGRTSVPPGSAADLQLNGPAPHGTIAAATFEVTDLSAATPLASTPIPTGASAP
ncbi:MAG: hypothetical protein ACREN2_13235 [Candidatus Dormibacteria bacterium]